MVSEYPIENWYDRWGEDVLWGITVLVVIGMWEFVII